MSYSQGGPAQPDSPENDNRVATHFEGNSWTHDEVLEDSTTMVSYMFGFQSMTDYRLWRQVIRGFRLAASTSA